MVKIIWAQDCVGVDTLNYTATIIVALAAQQAGRPNLIRSPKRVLAHTWEGVE